MLMDELVSCIKELKSRIKAHRNSLSENELRTRVGLIDPLLYALGWDVSIPELVTLEYSVDAGRADYALLWEDGKPVTILEAKKLGRDLANDRPQMLQYAISEGIPYAGLTDGNNWELYDVFKKVALNEKKILNISIEKDPAHHTALKLLCLWRPNLGSGDVTQASIPIVGLNDDPLPPPSPPLLSEDWVSFAKYEPGGGVPRPLAVRLWDGTEKEFKSWRKTAVMVFEALYREGSLNEGQLPYSPLNQVACVVNSKPEHINGDPFGQLYKRSKNIPFFINVNMSKGTAVRHLRKILDDFGKDPQNDIHWKVPQSGK